MVAVFRERATGLQLNAKWLREYLHIGTELI